MGNTSQKSGFAGSLQIQETLWSKARRVVKQQEVEEVKHIVGKGLIEENEGLFLELEGLVDILEGYREETDAMVREREGMRGGQKLQLEATLRDMLEKAKDLQSLSTHSSKLASHLMETSRSRQSFTIPANTPDSFPASTPETTLSSTMTSLGGVARDLTDIISSISLKSAEEIDTFEALSEDLREMLTDEQKLLLEDIEWVSGIIEEEVESRLRMNTYSEPDISTLIGLKQELEDSTARQEWSDRLRRLPSTKKKLPKTPLRSTGGCRGVFTAMTYRNQEFTTPSPPPEESSPRISKRRSCREGSQRKELTDPLEEARDWLAVTQTLCEAGDDSERDTAIQLLEQQPRPKHNRTPADRFDLGLEMFDSD